MQGQDHIGGVVETCMITEDHMASITGEYPVSILGQTLHSLDIGTSGIQMKG